MATDILQRSAVDTSGFTEPSNTLSVTIPGTDSTVTLGSKDFPWWLIALVVVGVLGVAWYLAKGKGGKKFLTL